VAVSAWAWSAANVIHVVRIKIKKIRETDKKSERIREKIQNEQAAWMLALPVLFEKKAK